MLMLLSYLVRPSGNIQETSQSWEDRASKELLKVIEA